MPTKNTDHFDGNIIPGSIYTTRKLAREWGRKDVRRLEESLERMGIRILRLGNGLGLVRGQDIWDRF